MTPSADAVALRRNQLLAALPDADLAEVVERVTVDHYAVRDHVYERDRPLGRVVFPLDAVFSFVAVAADDTMVEVATIGREGIVGLPAFLGASRSPHEAFCQVEGTAATLDVGHFHDLLGGRAPALRRVLGRYTQFMIVQVAQNVACARSHTTEERASRWILMTQDRVGADTFELTHGFLAQMLGVRRPTVSLTASVLQSAGLITYSRGRMTVLDRDGLMASACECYDLLRKEERGLVADLASGG